MLPETLKTQWDSAQFKQYRDAFPLEYSASPATFQAHCVDLVARDVKAPYLKALQGYLWEEGYKSGEIRAPLFEDVPPKLVRWHEKDTKIMIYSSGSVPAQRLLFRHTDAQPADLTFLITDWFDTMNAGFKTETASYKAIASKYPELSPSQWLFVSDNVKEVDAAIEAGMQSVAIQRPGNAELSAGVYERLHVIATLDALDDDCELQSAVNT